MGATLANLAKVRSQLAIDIRVYYETLISTLDVTPWYRKGQVIRARSIEIPAQVLKHVPTLPGNSAGNEDDRFSARRFLEPEIARYYEEPTREEREVVEWEQEQPLVQRAVIKGAPGGGKSFLTQTTAVKIARTALAQLQARAVPLNQLPLPIHLDLAKLAQDNLPTSLEDALLTILSARYAPSPGLKAWMRERMRSADCWLIFDALDQVPHGDRVQVRQQLQQIDTQRWQSRLILTCRSANYERGEIPWLQLTEYELAPHTAGQMHQFVARWFTADPTREQTLQRVLGQSFSLSHACRVPLVLTLTCLAHEEQAVTAETRRGDLYARVLRGLVRRAWKPGDRRTLHDPHVDDVRDALTSVAEILFTKQPTSNLFRLSEIMEAIGKAKHHSKPVLESVALRQELMESGILVAAGISRDDELQLSFLHRGFLEYLTARALAGKGWDTIATLIDKKAWSPAWQEVIILLAGQLEKPKEVADLLRCLTNEQNDDVLRHRLALAAQCLPEAHQTLRENENTKIAAQITTNVFTLWRGYQQNDTTGAVPHLTAALPALGQVNAQVRSGISFLVQVWELLIAENEVVRRAAILTIGALGSAAMTPEIFTALRTMLGDRDVREVAATTIENLDSVAATPQILMALCITMLTDQDRGFREAAATAIKKLSSVAATPERLIALRKMRMDRDWKIREAAAEAIRDLGSVAATPERLIALRTMWTEGDWYDRRVAAEVLGKLRAQGMRIFERTAGTWKMKSVQELSGEE